MHLHLAKVSRYLKFVKYVLIRRNSQTRPRTIRGSSLSSLNYEIGRFRPPTFVTGSFSSLICRLAPRWRPLQQSLAACSTSSRRAAAVARGSELRAPRRRGSHRRERGGQRSRGPRKGGRGRPHGPATAEEEGGTEEAGVLDESKEQGSRDAGGA